MYAKVSQHIVALVSLLLFLLTGQTSVQGYVWCLGEDGHTALEIATSNECGPADVSHGVPCHDDEDAFSTLHQDDHCGPCLDIPPSLEVTSSRYKEYKKLIVPTGTPAVLHVAASTSLTKVLLERQLPQPPPRVSQTILAHRTVVLLS